MWVTGRHHRARGAQLPLLGESAPLSLAVRPPNLDGHLVPPQSPDDRDVEHDRIARLDSDRVVAADNVEFAGQNGLRQLGEVERRGLPPGTPPEPRGDGDHGGKLNRKCFQDVTRQESLGNGAEVGGYLRNLNVMLATRLAALRSNRAAARGAVVPLTPAG